MFCLWILSRPQLQDSLSGLDKFRLVDRFGVLCDGKKKALNLLNVGFLQQSVLIPRAHGGSKEHTFYSSNSPTIPCGDFFLIQLSSSSYPFTMSSQIDSGLP